MYLMYRQMCLHFVILHDGLCLGFKSNQKLKSPYVWNVIACTRVFFLELLTSFANFQKSSAFNSEDKRI